MFQVDPQLIDWDSDSDDGELLDVQTAICTDVGSGRKLPCHNDHMDTPLNPKDILDGWMNQAYSELSTTHGYITDCKLLVYVLDPSCASPTCGQSLWC